MSSSSTTLRRRPTPARRRMTTPHHHLHLHHHHHPSPSSQARRPLSRRRRRHGTDEAIVPLRKSRSEPVLRIGGSVVGGGDECRSSFFDDAGWLFRPLTCADVFYFRLGRSDSCRSINEGYQKDAKVVVTVTVEGSPGPIKTMVKLGMSVDDTIRLVIDKYGKEGRSPPLDTISASSFDLHLSYFSLECLDRSNAIGEVGRRSFYLRKSTGRSAGDRLQAAASTPCTSLSVPVKESSHDTPVPIVFLPAHVTRRMTKLTRKMHKLWKLLGCFHCG